MEHLFIEISVMTIAATALGLVANKFRQPLVLGYVLAGFLLGPSGFSIISGTDAVAVLSTFGVAFLLFLVGIELDVDKLKQIGRSSVLLGIGQIIVTFVLGFGLVRALGFDSLGAGYVAIALALSSTVIVVKLLSEQQAIDSLYGRLAIGMLLVQDFVVILTLVVLSGFSTNTPPTPANIILLVFEGVALVTLALLCGKYLLPSLFRALAHSGELLLLASIAWCFTFAMLAAAMGLSVEIGAFLAGLSLARLPYNLEIVGKVRNLRDFFITIFFVALGSQLILYSLGSLFIPFLVLSLFVLIGNPLIVMVILGLLGYRKRTSLLVGLTVAQVSEFSLILMALGAKLGHVTSAEVSLVTLVGIVTITASTYLINHGEDIYRKLAPWLSLFEQREPEAELNTEPTRPLQGHVVLFGCDRLGHHLARTLVNLKKQVLVVDFNPELVAKLKHENIPALYGDMGDLEILERAQVSKASLVVSTVPDAKDNLLLIKDMRQRGLTVPIYVTATSWFSTRQLYKAGADYVIFPHYLSAEQVALMLRESILEPNRILVDKAKHLSELERRYGMN